MGNEHAGVDDELRCAGMRLATPEEIEFGGLEAINAPFTLDLIEDAQGVRLRPAHLKYAGLESLAAPPPRIVFEELEGNAIHELLAQADTSLGRHRGLRRHSDEGLTQLTEAVKGRSLLIVHGTFSHTDSVLEKMSVGDPGFLAWAHEQYDKVVTFDYPTLSRQALANAITLRRLAADLLRGDVDVISHSQGGLVTRYWLELLDRTRLANTRSVFVAGTLGGTSLAAPPALKRALDYLTNVAWVLRQGSTLLSTGVPFFSSVALLIGVLERSLGVLSSPIADTGVAIVPGFVGMSRASTNAELLELRELCSGVPPGYFAVTGEFEPVSPALKFWENWQTRLANGPADVLFEDANDLVVDTRSMTALSDDHSIAGADRVLHYAAGRAHVHHTNYFEQSDTMCFIRERLTR